MRNNQNRYDQTNITYPKLEETYVQQMKEDVTDDEVKKVVFAMSPWKALGPDGYPAGFYQKSWRIVGKHVCVFVKKL